jgi:hypothetical protein
MVAHEKNENENALQRIEDIENDEKFVDSWIILVCDP